MIATEEQVKMKWCPEARVRLAEAEQVGFNRIWSGLGSEGSVCLGSACMAWRWQAMPTRYQSDTPRDGWEHISAEDAAYDFERNTEFWLEPEADMLARRKGFCGKGGWPHHA